ncbi:MAG: TIGR03067 domain-containing protein [Planctomycetaceae bacterium]|jgi:uncharacterized protein (TIGR03067 family)|nr:TIGR03067 domain-containing protein [Planctomycetaceae bacterium]MBT6157402.1 TIGR03067 domain-containing protein [Planctomycetaceae bacterium]MBT6486883.1 TIGR03067 domain-containing protein [Planctomycetaceae bacterium]MBT6494788.1 TIGR03067 domain-containing protein [Planctomycetaceae bacterium]
MRRFAVSAVALATLTAGLATLPAVLQRANGQDAPNADAAKNNDLDLLQATWKFSYYEEKGEQQRPGTREFVISDKKLTYRSGGQDRIETTIEIDATKSPKHLTQTFPNGDVYRSIYVLADDYVILCGSRNKEKRPSKFSCATENGGEFLIFLKRE